MKIYQVGGSVRDELLGLSPKDLDYVVVGATQEEMLGLGYKLQGKDFPVFCHPQTKDEYALARTERKTGNGYSGFTCETDGVSLKDDLLRRDLTINAMAKDETGAIIDYHGGLKDLESKVLRHVSPHFSEDPLRVLRVARFQARYSDFSIAPETLELMSQLVESKELSHLPAERFKKEFEKAFEEKRSDLFLKTLYQVGFFTHYLTGFNYDEAYFSKVNEEVSLEAKMLYLVLGQDSIGEAMKTLQTKLGFKGHTYSEVLSFYSMSLGVKDFDSLYEFFKKSKPLSKTTSFALLKELYILKDLSLDKLVECEKMAQVVADSDFSFLEQLPYSERSVAARKYVLEKFSK